MFVSASLTSCDSTFFRASSRACRFSDMHTFQGQSTHVRRQHPPTATVHTTCNNNPPPVMTTATEKHQHPPPPPPNNTTSAKPSSTKSSNSAPATLPGCRVRWCLWSSYLCWTRPSVPQRPNSISSVGTSLNSCCFTRSV